MPSLILTTHCPNNCPWCFARAKMGEYRAQGIREMGWDDFVEAIRFFQRSGEPGIHLLGGEPLLHSRIVEILEHLCGQNLKAVVGTTGIVQSSLVDRLAGMKAQGISFGINSTGYFGYGPKKRAKVDYFFRSVGHRTGISYTLSERDLRMKEPSAVLGRIALITRFSLIRHVTLQIAAPADGNRDFVAFERYREIVDVAADWFRILEKNRITCDLDCHCMPTCQIPEGHSLAGRLRLSCRSFPLDIGPDLMVWPCFPLSEMGVSLRQFRDVSGLRRHFAETLRTMELRYDESCRNCTTASKGDCQGGCLGFQVLREQGVKHSFCEAGMG